MILKYSDAMKCLKICSNPELECQDCNFREMSSRCISNMLMNAYESISFEMNQKRAKITELERLLDEQRTNGQF